MKKIDETETIEIIERKNGKVDYKLIHEIKENNNEYIITAKLVISKESKIIKKCKEQDMSPITKILSANERKNKILINEGKTEKKLYFNEE